MPRASRTRAVSAVQVRGYLAKAEEYLAAATTELEANRPLAASSLAIHAAINAADAVTGHRVGRRAAGQDHAQVRAASSSLDEWSRPSSPQCGLWRRTAPQARHRAAWFAFGSHGGSRPDRVAGAV